MSTTQGEVRQLKEGRYVVIDEEPCKILSITTSKPGKHGASKARIDAVGMFDGVKRSMVAPVTEKCKIPMIDKRKVQILNISGNQAQVMDMETYQNFELPVSESEKAALTPGAEVLIMEAMGKMKFWNVGEDDE
ncbi:MAG TPA: translation initiation factor IF-5A [Candidatus Thermoplasmatota archaeon]|nr:translation initiation factor IF-5A [Candidatus Thermoplasmatota archaeon]